MLRDRLFKGYVSSWMPVALFLLLTGMFWIGDRSLYHKLYYIMGAVPTLIVVCLCWRRFSFLREEPLFLLFIVFSFYVMLSLAWSPGAADYSKLKHPLYIGMLIVAVAAVGEHDMRRLVQALGLAGGVAALAALASSVAHVAAGQQARFEGFGALYNPLLTSHVYGFFAALWLGALLSSSRLRPLKLMMLVILVFLLFQTGSRTPFLALGFCFVWLLVLVADRRIVWLATALGIIAAAGLWLFGANLVERGLSYRPFIWVETWRQIMPALWFGHGYDADIDIVLTDVNVLLADPHNLTLAVVYQTGLIGGALWLAIYAYGFFGAWRLRSSGLVLISSTLLVYGFMAGMTEGGSFMSRPKEHWFLVWIPIAIHLAVLRKIKRSRAPGAPISAAA
ncbi:O-antigen ligase family protein [Ectopseudomonas guguanensis]|uniref:O-antigen ligase n=1 Tax=Ectopseudomonas guguanensis TaxID=1198456 RepID=A0A1H0VCC4_9GAMM|nr:O-antigen ligase family protein [Pseudomonas guguanensis]SDP75746.1 O-antigen ligase [Pseudomonas guguanensis]